VIPPAPEGAHLAGPAGASGGQAPEGVHHRPPSVTCEPFTPREGSRIGPIDWDGGLWGYECAFDADCTERPHGYCYTYEDVATSYSTCRYGCVSDVDCDPGQVCDCGWIANECVRAGCVTDAECGAGLCLRTSYNDGCGHRTVYQCQTALDACARDADCDGHQVCAWDGTRHACMYVDNCGVGRPFLVEGRERLAPPVGSDDWRGDVRLSPPASCTQVEARTLARRWTEIALMEHASVAAFARFALQLLAFGAPPALVMGASEAMADEVRHAEQAFALASHFAGAPVGPGSLPIEGALGDDELSAVVVNVVREGCCGETVAALAVEVAASGARDPELAARLSGVAADERRHAELAWAFVRWAMEGRPEVGSLALAAAEDELRRARARRVPETGDEWIAPHGLVPAARRHALRIEVLDDLVLPCLEALCQRSSPQGDRRAA
jgi:hypothetical protein